MRAAFRGTGAIVSALTAALGCGGASGSPPIALGQVSAETVAVVCHKVLTCCSSSEIAAIDPMIVDEASCQARLVPSSGSVLATGPARVDAGVVVYDAEAARACLDALAAFPCDRWGGPSSSLPLAPCGQVFKGKLPAGSSCGLNVECVSEYCGDTPSGSFACAAPANLGDSCEFAPCTPGLSCVSNPSSGGPRTCSHPFSDGTACLYDRDCNSGFCIVDGSTGLSTCGSPQTCNGL